MTRDTAAFRDWRDSADGADLLEMAKRLGAKLTQPYRGSREWIGPCPSCGGVDRFSLNTAKNKWNCRSGGGGSGAIDMVMHAGQMSFLEACEWITGRPNPNGREAKPLSPEQRAEIEQRRAAAEASQRAREAEQAAHEESTKEAAAAIWNASVGLAGTLGESYLHGFKHRTPPGGWPDCLRFHGGLYVLGVGRFAALVARVDDLDGNLTGIWREYIGPDGKKAPVSNQKMGLGPVAGGAIRLGGLGPKIGAAEGLRTALGAWALIDYAYPVWSCLSTAGLIGFEIPLVVQSMVGFPDGDMPVRWNPKLGMYVPCEPPGRAAMRTLRDRAVSEEGVEFVIAAEPPPLVDYENICQAAREEVA